ncbi:MAG: DUF6082 family protein [Negativicutes bacterium]|nr:DUF6082 family protein [Negativicutes bacterium]
MGAFSSWVDGNWFNLIQTLGIMGSLCLTAAASNREAKAKEVENLLALAEHHQELWSGAAQRKDLERVFQPNADTQSKPATAAEMEFLNLAFVHFETSWWIARSGGIVTLEELRTDAHSFLALPLPRAVWEKTKQSRNREFVQFVDRAIEAG